MRMVRNTGDFELNTLYKSP